MQNTNETLKIQSILEKEKIEYFCILPATSAEIINQRLMPEKAKSIITFLVPYRTDYEASKELAHFAKVRDYHAFSKHLFDKIVPKLKEAFPNQSFFGFADHSPVNERKLADQGGLGEVGKNGLLLNEKYGSYVFIGEIITTAELPTYVHQAKKLCTECNKCVEACPKKDMCISAISQKKKKTDDDYSLLKAANTVWGCDKCAEVCPINEKASLSPLDFFYINKLSSPLEIPSLTDEEFNSYPFSYRGRKCIEDNIKNVLTKSL